MTPLEQIWQLCQEWWASGHPLVWPDASSLPPEAWLFVGLIVLFPLVILRMMSSPVEGKDSESKERKHRDTPTIERFFAWLKPPPDPIAFGHIVASFKWLPHMIVFGAPGSGKSTFMYNRILDPLVGSVALISFLTWGLLPRRKRRGKLIVTGNLSKPFRGAVLWLLEHGFYGLIWTPNPNPGEGFGLDVLEGPPENVGERCIAMQPSGQGNTGLRSGAVEGMLVDACYELIHQGKGRTFHSILELLPSMGKRPLGPDGKPDFSKEPQQLTNNERQGIEDWCTRFRTLTRRLGSSVGSDVRISEVLAQGGAILIEGSSYNNPNSIEPLMQLMVYLSMWLVGAVGNFDLLIDEPGAVGPGTFTRLLTATRAQGVRIVIGMQSRKQVDDTLREMCHTALLCGAAGDAPEARDFESKVTDKDIPPEDFVLLEPRRWYELLLVFWPRRGLYSLEGYLFSNGRLDKVQATPFDESILKRWPSGTVPCLPVGIQHPYQPRPESGSVPRPAVPSLPTGTAGGSEYFNGTDVWDGEYGTAEDALESGTVEILALPPATKPSPPDYFVHQPLLLKEWEGLTGTVDPMGCWLIDAKKTNSEGRSKIWVSKGTLGWGETVLQKGGYVTGYVIVCHARRGSAPEPEIDEDGKLKPWQVDHWCHTEDIYCPGGKQCVHLRCMNGDHMSWVSPRQNTVRMRVRQRRRKQMLAGQTAIWTMTVAEEADMWIKDHPLAAAV